MPEYRIETGTQLVVEKQLNALVAEGWKPILMSTTATSTNVQSPIAITVILQKVRK